MKVCHIIAPVRFGGGESLLINLLKNNQIDQFVISLFKSDEFKSKSESINKKNYQLTQMTLGDGVNKKTIFLYSIFVIFYISHLIKIIKNEKPDIIHTHGYPCNILALFIKLSNPSIKMIDTRHFYLTNHSVFQKIFFKFIYIFFNKVTCVSKTVLKSFLLNYPSLKNKSTYIHNCIGDLFFKDQNDRKINNKKIFVQIARFSKFKNHELIIRSLNKLCSSIRNEIEIWFIGDGEHKEYLVKLTNELGLDNVKFYGFVDNLKIPDLLDQANFGLFPSDLEGFGIAAVECMSRGLPILALKNELMEEIVGDSGVLVDKNNFVSGFIDILNDEENLRIKSIVRSLQFSPDSIVDQYNILYKNTLLDPA